ncbi:MAG: RNA-binding protein [Alphaproteobacteria bacterium HGW-Alphaproteobacteria-6]|nr:MAG: RNA-binding protein [Alphaproteobacteria bacterium HGW-Alphaproteobacteria-6]
MTGETRIRLDKWLWQARAFRSRSLAAAAVLAGRVRINGVPTQRPADAVGPGDVLTFSQGSMVRLWRVRAAGTRRGPAAEAQGLYDDLDGGARGHDLNGGANGGAPRPGAAE